MDDKAIASMTDSELIRTLVDDQIATIKNIRRFAHNPLAQPGHTPEEKAQISALWEEAGRRQVRNQVRYLISEWEKYYGR